MDFRGVVRAVALGAAGGLMMFACDTGPSGGSATPVDSGSLPDVVGQFDAAAPDADAGSPIEDASDAARPGYTLAGTVAGLAGQGLVLQAGTEVIPVGAGATSFAFASKLTAGSAYSVTVKAQPTQPWQTCAISNGEGTANADVSNVVVTCATNTYSINVRVTGLSASGLVLHNGTEDLPITAGTLTSAFATKVPSGQAYDVTIATQPAGQRCTVTGGSGSVVGGDASVAVNCVDSTYLVGGSVSGLVGAGLVLQNKLAGDLPVNANGTFAFSKTERVGTAYDVTVKTQPSTPSQTCVVTNGTGTVGTADVSTIAVACTTNRYNVSGTVTGLEGDELVLQNNTLENVTVKRASPPSRSRPSLQAVPRTRWSRSPAPSAPHRRVRWQLPQAW